jgi:hypothetical protein
MRPSNKVVESDQGSERIEGLRDRLSESVPYVLWLG